MLRSKFHPGRDYALATFAACIFAWLAFTLSTGGPTPLDVAVRASVHSWATSTLTTVVRFITQLGGGFFLFPLAALIVFGLYREHRRREAALFVVAVLGANILDEAMKLVFYRPRPTPWFDYPKPPSFSFPSGHAFVSFCFYLALAEILIQDEWPLWKKIATWTGGVTTTLAIGFSRAYLGVHYPTDVIAGWVAAIAWTTMIRIAHHTLWRPGATLWGPVPGTLPVANPTDRP